MRWGKVSCHAFLWCISRKKTALGLLCGVLAAAVFGGGMVCQAAGRPVRFRNTLEGLDDLEDLEEIDGGEEISDEELSQALEEYFSRLDENSYNQEEMASEKITDPVLSIENQKDGRLRYTLPNGNYFLSSVPCGMITAGSVDLELPEGTVGFVSRDDEPQAFPDSWHFTEKGCYYVRLLILQPPGNSEVDYNIYEVDFYFTIIDKTDNTLGAVPAPEGFVITTVRLDGKVQEIDNARCLFLRDDGYYEIQYMSTGKEKTAAETVFTRDTRAPFLSFSKEAGPKGVPGPVEFYPSETGCRVSMNYNGNHGYAVTNTLTAAGSYDLSVEDAAGNSRVYHVKLRQVYNPVDLRLVGAAAVAAVLAIARLLFLRRNMKVL